MSYLPAALRQQVRARARNRCEYCMLAEEDAYFPHEPDHIIAEKHGGTNTLENLALACFDCNRFKGANIASLDPESGKLSLYSIPARKSGMITSKFAAARSLHSLPSVV